MDSNLLHVEAVHKSFGGVIALDGVSLDLAAAEVLAIAGDNGAGKSTLLKVITGVYKPDSGRLVVNGVERVFRSPKDALAAGIAAAYQDLALCDNLSGAANLFLGEEPRQSGLRGRLGLLDIGRMHEKARSALEALGIRSLLSTHTRVMYLSGGQRQAIAIVRATIEKANIVVLDEPTAALGVQEREHVYTLLKNLQAQGYGVIVVSHSIPEILRLATRVMVLRLGQVVATFRRSEFDSDAIVAAITGSSGDTGSGS